MRRSKPPQSCRLLLCESSRRSGRKCSPNEGLPHFDKAVPKRSTLWNDEFNPGLQLAKIKRYQRNINGRL